MLRLAARFVREDLFAIDGSLGCVAPVCATFPVAGVVGSDGVGVARGFEIAKRCSGGLISGVAESDS